MRVRVCIGDDLSVGCESVRHWPVMGDGDWIGMCVCVHGIGLAFPVIVLVRAHSSITSDDTHPHTHPSTHIPAHTLETLSLNPPI